VCVCVCVCVYIYIYMQKCKAIKVVVPLGRFSVEFPVAGKKSATYILRVVALTSTIWAILLYSITLCLQSAPLLFVIFL